LDSTPTPTPTPTPTHPTPTPTPTPTSPTPSPTPTPSSPTPSPTPTPSSPTPSPSPTHTQFLSFNQDSDNIVIFQKRTEIEDGEISLYGRYYAVVSDTVGSYDFMIESGFKHTESYPMAGTWEILVENNNDYSVTYNISWEMMYTNISSLTTDAPYNVITLTGHQVQSFVYISPDSSLLVGQTTENYIPMANISATYNRFSQSDFDYVFCNEADCSNVSQIGVAGSVIGPGNWYLTLSNPTDTPISVILWFNSLPCVPTCNIRGKCGPTGLCPCIAQMYNGFDCSQVTIDFMTYMPLVIAGAILAVLV